MTFQGSENVSDFYIKLKSLWKDVDTYGNLPHCDCLKIYICNINGRINDREKRLKVRKFLMAGSI